MRLPFLASQGRVESLLRQARWTGKTPRQVLTQGIGEDALDAALVEAAQRERAARLERLMRRTDTQDFGIGRLTALLYELVMEA